MYSFIQCYRSITCYDDMIQLTVSIVARVFIHVFIVSIYCVYLVYNAVQCTVEYSKQMVRESSSKVLLC